MTASWVVWVSYEVDVDGCTLGWMGAGVGIDSLRLGLRVLAWFGNEW